MFKALTKQDNMFVAECLAPDDLAKALAREQQSRSVATVSFILLLTSVAVTAFLFLGATAGASVVLAMVAAVMFSRVQLATSNLRLLKLAQRIASGGGLPS